MTTLTIFFDTSDRRGVWKLTIKDGDLAATVRLRGAVDFAEAKREARAILGYSPRWKVSTNPLTNTEVAKATSPKTDLLSKAWAA